MTLADLAPVANHLWQSTVFVGVVWLLSLLLRSNRASVRYWLWFAASLKFLIPFEALIAVGRQLGWRSPTTITQPNVTFVIDTISQPFSGMVVTAVSSSVPTQPSLISFLPLALLAIWAGGSAMHLLAWWVRWRRVSRIVRKAVPLEPGRESTIFHHVEALAGRRQAITVVTSDACLEPGIFGVLKPVLFWPRGIGSRLSDSQIEALLTHELCHVHRRDNLAATMHMLVEAAFWFHPAIWWIEQRLVDEREQACDEEVVRLGGDPQSYAESILKTCEFYAESPLVCVSGITGSDLKRRVEAIMRGDGRQGLSIWKLILLVGVGAAVFGSPVGIGMLNAKSTQVAQGAEPDALPAFDVASVKANKSDDPRIMELDVLPSGMFKARNVPLRQLILLAYNVRDTQLFGAPSWINAERYDINAKTEIGLTSGQAPPQLRQLLIERFNLTVHRETRELPIYHLVQAKSDGTFGPALRRPSIDACAEAKARPGPPSPPQPGQRIRCGMRGTPGTLTAGSIPITALAGRLVSLVGRTVVDRTGLDGVFDFDLAWTPDQAASSDTSGPSIFTALQEQLGLKLESTRGPVEVLLIHNVERPSDDAADIGQPSRLIAQSATQSAATSSSRPIFEVASIKPNKSGEVRTRIQAMQPGGRFNGTNVSLRALVRMAYQVQDFQLSGPKWIDSDRFDVQAKADRSYAADELPRMLQVLLAERFQLAVHEETKDLNLYTLVLASSEGKLGPRLRPSTIDCVALRASGDPPPPASEPSKVPPCVTQTFGGRHMIASGMPLGLLARALSVTTKAVVIDQTDLQGDFDFELEWTPDGPAAQSADSSGGGAQPTDAAPSIFTAVREQLGLKLEPHRGPVQVLVIDRVEKPTPD